MVSFDFRKIQNVGKIIRLKLLWYEIILNALRNTKICHSWFTSHLEALERKREKKNKLKKAGF